MKAARTRIGRVTMKNGGADVRVLHREATLSPVAQHMREWVGGCLNKERVPDAYGAVAFWFDDDAPGRPGVQITYLTSTHKVPAPVLVRMIGPYLISAQAAHVGATDAIEAMGGEIDDWRPDDAS